MQQKKIYQLITMKPPGDSSIVLCHGTKEEVQQFVENHPDWELLDYPGHEYEGANSVLQVLTLAKND